MSEARVDRSTLKMIEPGIYSDEQGAMHFYASEYLVAKGIPDNEHNRRMVERQLAELLPGVPTEWVKEPEVESTRLPQSRCPRCAYQLDAVTPAYGPESSPEAGAVSLCLNCGQLMIFESDLSLRSLTAAEIRRIMEDEEAWAVIEKAQGYIQRRGKIA